MIYAKLINKTKTLLGVICECSSRYLKLEVNTGKLIKNSQVQRREDGL